MLKLKIKVQELSHRYIVAEALDRSGLFMLIDSTTLSLSL
jgi:hypothetical protein